MLQQPDLPQPPGRRDDGADHDDDLDDDRLVVDHDGGPVDGFDAHDERDHERGDQQTTPTTTTAATTTTPTTSGTTTTGTTTTGTTTPGTTSTATTPIGNGETTPTGGGGQVGLLLISSYVKPNTADTIDYYNHYSLLRSIEKLFGLKYLGYAGNIQLSTLDAGTFNAYTP